MRYSTLQIRQALAAGLVLLAACGGDGGTQPAPPAPPPPPPPPPAAVATVTLSPETATLVPQQTQALTVTLRDAAGAALNGRTVAWSSDSPTIATVSSAGLVTAAALGRAIISATSEGRTGTAEITVAAGALVGALGGTVTLADSTVTLTIPAGALSAPTPISVTPLSQPPAGLPPGWKAVGPMYAMGPNGSTFTQPVTVTIKFDRTKLPIWVMTGDLSVLRYSGNQWNGLTDVTVDIAARTVSGRTTGFSDFGLAVEDPEPAMAPASGSVNATHRAVKFTVFVKPRGEGGELTATSGPLLYRWRTTGEKGEIVGPGPDEWTTVEEVQYLATYPSLGTVSGRIDDVTVDLLLNPESLTDLTAGPQRIVSATASVDADLSLTYDITPSSPVIDAGESTDLHLLVTNKEGAAVTLGPTFSVAWESSSIHGSLVTTEPAPRPLAARYTAKEVFSSPPRRVDDVIAKVTEETRHRVRRYTVFAGAEYYFVEDRIFNVDRGQAKVYVEVKVDYKIKLVPSLDTIPVDGKVRLDVTLEPAYDGPGLRYRYTRTGSQGTIDAASGVLTENTMVNYQAGSWGGGADVVKVEVVSTAAGVELGTVGTAEAKLVVDPWRPAGFAVIQNPTTGGAFVAAQVSVPKIPGASHYHLEVLNDGVPYVKGWDAATSTNANSVNEVLDGGTVWRINLEGGFATTAAGISGRRNVYVTKYSAIKAKYRAEP